MQPNQDFGRDLAIDQVDDRDRAFVGDVSDRIDSHQGAASGRASDAAGVGPATAPIADIGFSAGQDDIVRRGADIEDPELFSRVGVQFQQTIGQVQRHIEPPAIAGNGQAGWNVLFPTGQSGFGQRNRIKRGDLMAWSNSKDLDAAVDVGQENARAVR